MAPSSAERPPTTPPSALLTLDSTPRSIRSAGDGHTQTDLRERIAHEMKSEMLICNVDIFQRSYLPIPPTEDDIDACMERLTKAGLLEHFGDSSADGSRHSATGLRWTKFPAPPSMIEGLEPVIFSLLARIAAELEKHKLGTHDRPRCVGTPQFRYRNCPHDTIASEIEGSNFKIDGCFVPAGGFRGKLTASNVAVVAEYKKSGERGMLQDNHLKVLSAANHIMNDDPRRMFTFGLTIEDEMMSLWYFSRSHSTKSEEFNFIEDYRTLISVFLSFLFADERNMGYDTTIHRIQEDSTIRYVYEIHSGGVPRYFKVNDALSSYRPLCITGRMTHVWQAVEVQGPDGLVVVDEKLVALKDVWLDEDARMEKDIQDEIFAAIEAQWKLEGDQSGLG